jgi:hypothetical protein
MNEKTTHQFKVELRSFFAIIVLNLMFAALALGLGISTFIIQILAMIEAGTLLITSLILMIAGALAFTLGFLWIIVCAELLDGISDITSAYDRVKKDADDEHVTGLIIKLLAQYRSKKPSIQRMTLLATIGGAVFIIGGASGVIQAAADPFLTSTVLDLLRLGGGMINIIIGIASLIIVRYFHTYTRVWDTRLQETTKAEETLTKKLEDTRDETTTDLL